SLPLPLFDHNQGAVAHATAEIEAANLELAAALGEARAEVQRASRVLTKRREALATLEKEVVERMPALRTMAEDAYREGSSSILELLDAFRSLKELKLHHLEALENVAQAEAELISAAALDQRD